MTDDALCPCGSQNSFYACCNPFISGDAVPTTPEALMRSRYTAYHMANIDYITDTMKGKALRGFDPVSTLQWANEVQFQTLEVIKTTEDTVEFKAYYQHNSKSHVMHENSQFKKIKSRWYYIDSANNKKPSRNQPCPCGSDKKYKRCCGR